MREYYNSIANKYVDNELNSKELNEVEELLSTNDDFKKTLSVHKYVHESLYEIPQKLAPNGFTELLMTQIVNRISDKYKKNYWFRGVIAFFSLFLVATLFLFFYFVGSLEFVQSASSTVNNYTEKIIPTFRHITEFVKTDIFKTVTGLISFIILVGFYFNMNSHKQLKNRLKEF